MADPEGEDFVAEGEEKASYCSLCLNKLNSTGNILKCGNCGFEVELENE